jgi:hypothetical protein
MVAKVFQRWQYLSKAGVGFKSDRDGTQQKQLPAWRIMGALHAQTMHLGGVLSLLRLICQILLAAKRPHEQAVAQAAAQVVHAKRLILCN